MPHGFLESARNTGTDAMGKSIKRRETVNPEKKLANLFSRRRHTNAVPVSNMSKYIYPTFTYTIQAYPFSG